MTFWEWLWGAAFAVTIGVLTRGAISRTPKRPHAEQSTTLLGVIPPPRVELPVDDKINEG